MSTKHGNGASAKRAIDPLLQQRLERLGSHRTAGSVGAPLPPPTLPGATVHSSAAATATPAPTKRRTPRRVKPARASKLAALTLSLATTAGLSGWFAHVDASHATDLAADPLTSTAAAAPASTAPASTVPAPATTVTTAATTRTTAPAPATTAAPATMVDGTYTGDAANTRYGPVQVAVVYQNGSIVDVVALDYPASNRRDQAINSYAIPRLISGALSVQSAQVDTVSGATYTSKGYRASLQSAIDAAKQVSGMTA